jgi:glyoxylase-like metal-dependent hydrolase (beta-lactamase superfamily II)
VNAKIHVQTEEAHGTKRVTGVSDSDLVLHSSGDVVEVGDIKITLIHTPGHTPGSVCLQAPDEGVLFSGDTLFAGGWGRVDLPGGSAEQIVESLARLSELESPTAVFPGHGPTTTIARERPWLELVKATGRLPL